MKVRDLMKYPLLVSRHAATEATPLFRAYFASPTLQSLRVDGDYLEKVRVML